MRELHGVISGNLPWKQTVANLFSPDYGVQYCMKTTDDNNAVFYADGCGAPSFRFILPFIECNRDSLITALQGVITILEGRENLYDEITKSRKTQYGPEGPKGPKGGN